VALLLGAALLAPVFGGVLADDAGEDEDWSALKDGREIFEAACATCHGARGTGADRASRGFEVEPPDFTDCKFTSREQKADWVGIATEGGPVKAFDPLMPAFGKVLSGAQIEAAVGHAKAFCPEKRWPPGEFNLPKALNTGKAFPEDEVRFAVSSTVEEPVAIHGKLVVAGRVGARHQLEAVIPGGAQQLAHFSPDGKEGYRWGEGVGDISLGWKGVLWHHLPAGTIGGLALDVLLPTGDTADGFGKGIFSFEPALLIGQIIPRVGFLQLQAGAEFSTDPGVAGHVLFWRGAVGRTFRQGGEFGRQWSPMVEILGATEIDDGEPPDWDIVPQLQVALSTRQHVRLGLGAQLPLTRFDDRQIEIQAYLVWDWYDGGFGEGW
jgi:mono/diheme cytochrome c family protein